MSCGGSCKCEKPIVLFKKLHPDAQIPCYQSVGASGFDLASIEDITIHPGETVIIRTGLACQIPEGWEMQIRPRSGIAAKTPLLMKNAPGTIDCDYLGEVGIIMHCLEVGNTGNRPCKINKGDRIAQGVIAPAVQATIMVTAELTKTVRGHGGYGHTGVN